MSPLAKQVCNTERNFKTAQRNSEVQRGNRSKFNQKTNIFMNFRGILALHVETQYVSYQRGYEAKLKVQRATPDIF